MEHSSSTIAHVPMFPVAVLCALDHGNAWQALHKVQDSGPPRFPQFCCSLLTRPRMKLLPIARFLVAHATKASASLPHVWDSTLSSGCFAATSFALVLLLTQPRMQSVASLSLAWFLVAHATMALASLPHAGTAHSHQVARHESRIRAAHSSLLTQPRFLEHSRSEASLMMMMMVCLCRSYFGGVHVRNQSTYLY